MPICFNVCCCDCQDAVGIERELVVEVLGSSTSRGNIVQVERPKNCVFFCQRSLILWLEVNDIKYPDGKLFQLLSKCFHWRPFRMVLLKFPWDVQSNSHVMEWKNIKWINFDRANWTSFREDDNDNSSTPSNTNIS